MRIVRFALFLIICTIFQLQFSGVVRAADYCGSGETPQFRFGFAHLKSLLGPTMGEPLECEHGNPENGDTLQQTTTGLSFYRKSTNTPTFTDGWTHWAWTADGLVTWTGDSIDPPGSATPTEGSGEGAKAPAAGPPEPGPVATTMDRFLGETSQPSVPARRYAAEIVSIGETRYIQMQPLLADVSYVASLQAWGANTWRVIVHYETDSDGNILWSRLPQLETAIVTARTNGLAVLLNATNFHDEFSGGTTAENRANLYAQRQAAALDLARFAERLNIEYFSPINEAEGILDNEAYGDGYGSAPVQDRVGIAVNPRGEPSLTSRVGEISTLFESMAPHLRSVYSGRLVAHFGTSHPDYRVPSYDYIGITLDHYMLDPSAFRTVIGSNLDHVAAAASASGTKWMVEETYFYWSEVADPWLTGNRPNERKAGEIGEWEDADEVARLRDLQDDYFRISLEEYAARAGGSGYAAGGWLMPGIEISGSPAETVLQEFFAGR